MASILEATGDTSGATLQVLRPDNVSDDAVATYLIQAYSDAGATTKVSCWWRRNWLAQQLACRREASVLAVPHHPCMPFMCPPTSLPSPSVW